MLVSRHIHVTFHLDLDLEHTLDVGSSLLGTIVCKFGGDPAICLVEEAICAKSLQTDRRTDGRCAIALAHWNELTIDANDDDGVGCIKCFQFAGGRAVAYVGVHIRRADMANNSTFTVADAGYFRRAVRLMTRKFPGRQLVFVVCSDDLPWSKQHFSEAVSRELDHVTVGNHGNGNHSDADATNASMAEIAFSENHSAEEDLAILSSCNHTIMTVGTYGWWAAYLAGGLTIYYR